MENLNSTDFIASADVRLNELPTTIDIGFHSEDEVCEALKKMRKKLSKLQEKMYANNRYSVLVCLQGMDTSGKDSLIREVFKQFNPRGVNAYSFKTPTSTELEHDYLWRHYIALPERGKFSVYNRSHYENVLVSRVHPEYILSENLPAINDVGDITGELWQQRFEQINNFEKHISQNGVIVFKFFLYISKDEQKRRLLRRLDNEKHNWKFAPSDLEEREHWDAYLKYYEEAINNTSQPHAPWYIIPADDKPTARFLVAKTIFDELQKYDIAAPEVAEEVLENINKYRQQLRNEE
jgi:PPK2 family polyphosphate:nucleotide phosphotransferase